MRPLGLCQALDCHILPGSQLHRVSQAVLCLDNKGLHTGVLPPGLHKQHVEPSMFARGCSATDGCEQSWLDLCAGTCQLMAGCCMRLAIVELVTSRISSQHATQQACTSSST